MSYGLYYYLSIHIGVTLNYLDKNFLKIAHRFLKDKENFFSTTHHSNTYYEWMIVNTTRDHSAHQIGYIYHLAHQYPQTHQLLQDTKNYINNDFLLVYPEELQNRINTLRKLAFAVFSNEDAVAYEELQSLANKTNCSNTSISYYQEVVSAFKKVADIYSSENIDSQLVKRVSKLASDLIAKADMTNTKSLLKIKEIKFIKKITEEKYIETLITKPESKTLEFKSSLILDVKKNEKNKSLSRECLKTIVAFLNTDGGDLLIGINDDGKVSGLNYEIDFLHSGSIDKFTLLLNDLIKSYIGVSYFPFINWGHTELNGLIVMRVRCEKSKYPCYYKDNEFYIRTNPASHKLQNEDIKKHIDIYFNSFPS